MSKNETTDSSELQAKDEHKLFANKILKPLGLIFLGFNLFVVPQLLVGVVLGSILTMTNVVTIDELQNSDKIGVTFAFYGAAELVAVGALILTLKAMNLSFRDLGIKVDGLNFWWVVLPGFVAYFLITTSLGLLASLYLSDEILNAEQDLGFDGANQLWEVILAFCALVIIAPVVEELLFRGFLFKGLRKYWPFPVAAVVSALLFGLAHLQINVGLDTFALALVLAFIVEKTGNLWLSISLHAAKNLVAFTLLFLVK